MKKLLFVRHGKAADDSRNGDFGRELKHSGEKDVEHLAKKLKHKDLIPELIVTSDAARAKATANIIAGHLHLTNIIENHGIYEAGDDTLFNIITGLSNDHKFVMLAGHNPGFSSIASYLTDKYINLPTSGAVLIEFKTKDWAEVSSGMGKVEWLHDH